MRISDWWSDGCSSDLPKPGDAPDKDRINNGALDNAAGISTMLEVARAFAESDAKPRRSIVFLASTGEEKGLLGADYYAKNPAVPAKQIAGHGDQTGSASCRGGVCQYVTNSVVA